MHSADPKAVAPAVVIVLASVAGFMGLVAPRKPMPLQLSQPPAARDLARAPERPAGPMLNRGARPRPPQAADVVEQYYAALDARRFEAAWSMLPRAVRARFGSFGSWRAGYATTISSRPERIAVTRERNRATVSLVLEASDRAPCGVLRRSYAVRWRLLGVEGRWTARSIRAAARPSSRCVAR